jgi:acyl carrier protein
MALLAKHARTSDFSDETPLFGDGLDLASIAFIEFIMDLEETGNVDIDVDGLDASIRTVGQLWRRLAAS